MHITKVLSHADNFIVSRRQRRLTQTLTHCGARVSYGWRPMQHAYIPKGTREFTMRASA